MISRRSLLHHGATVTALAGIAVAAVQCQPTEAPAAEHDPLLLLIRRYREQMAIYNAAPSSVGTDEDDALAELTWRLPYDALCTAPPAATTLVGAVDAVRLVADEEEHCGGQEELTVNVLRAALAFFEGSASS